MPDSGRPETDAAAMDAGATARECRENSECDDGVPCSRDTCEAGWCVATAVHEICDDGVFCNGPETCDPNAGCMPSGGRSCDDADGCTVDRCDEALNACVNEPLDVDGDGEPDSACAGGTDCDDDDPLIGSSQMELCADSVDNDCDDATDETICARPAHDTCDDALDISAGGVFVVDTSRAQDDASASCAGPAEELVASLTIAAEDAPRDVRIDVTNGAEVGGAQLVLRSDCGVEGSELGCRAGSHAQIRSRSLGAGTYAVFVASEAPGEVELAVSLSPPTTRPAHQSCSTAIDVTNRGPQQIDFVGATDETELFSCGEPGAGDLMYTVTIEAADAPKDLVVWASGAVGTRDANAELRVEVRTDCADDASELRCIAGSPVAGRLHALPAGQYTVIVEGPTTHDVDATIELRLEPPTAPPL